MARTRKKKNIDKQNRKMNLYQMIYEIYRHSANKGILILTALLGFLFVALLKYPSDKLPELVYKFLDYSFFGYFIISLFCNILLTLFVLYMRKKCSQEHKRIGLEKSKLQSISTGIKLESSDDK